MPDDVPAGILSVTGPLSVGTFTSDPSAASANVTGRVRVRSFPLRPKNLCGSHVHANEQVAGLGSLLPGLPAPLRADARTVGDAGRDLHGDVAASAGKVEANLALRAFRGLFERKRDVRLDIASATRALLDVDRNRKE